MLSKLLRYEFKDTARVIPFFYLIAAILSSMVFLSEKMRIDWFRITSSVLLLIFGFAIIVVTFVVIVLRFYKNLYSDEGYLMFTLPVKPQLLLVSKAIVGFCWMLLSTIAFVAALSLSLYGFGIEGNLFTNIMKELEKYGLQNAIYPIIGLIILQLLYLLGQIYFSITMSNRPAFQGLGAASAFLVFIATYIILQIVEAVFTVFAPISLKVSMNTGVDLSISSKNMFSYLMDNFNGIAVNTLYIGLGGYIFVLVMVCTLFYMTGRMMDKKISLR